MNLLGVRDIRAEHGVAAGGDITARDIIIGLDQAQLAALMREWRAAESVAVEKVAELAGRLTVKDSAVTNFLRMLDEQAVPEDQLAAKLAAIASRHLTMEREIELLRSGDRQIQMLRAEAEGAMSRGDYDTAENLLNASLANIRAVELLRRRDGLGALEQLVLALQSLAPVVAADPGNVRYYLARGYIHKTAAQALAYAGDATAAKGELQSALMAFLHVHEEVPAHRKSVAELASAVNGIGNVWYQRAEPVQAIASYEYATALDPSYAYAWHDLFAAYAMLAHRGEVRLEAMRHALERTRATGAGLPGLASAYLDSLEAQIEQYASASPPAP